MAWRVLGEAEGCGGSRRMSLEMGASLADYFHSFCRGQPHGGGTGWPASMSVYVCVRLIGFLWSPGKHHFGFGPVTTSEMR